MHMHPKTGIAVMAKVRVVCACPLRPAAGLCPGACISCPTVLFQGGGGTLEVAVLTCRQCPHINSIYCKFYLCLHEETRTEISPLVPEN